MVASGSGVFQGIHGMFGWGVIGMEERMALLKGTLILQRLDGRWTVHVSLPNGIRAAPQGVSPVEWWVLEEGVS